MDHFEFKKLINNTANLYIHELKQLSEKIIALRSIKKALNINKIESWLILAEKTTDMIILIIWMIELVHEGQVLSDD